MFPCLRCSHVTEARCVCILRLPPSPLQSMLPVCAQLFPTVHGNYLFVCLFVCFIASQHTLNQLRLQQYTTPTVYVSSKLPSPHCPALHESRTLCRPSLYPYTRVICVLIKGLSSLVVTRPLTQNSRVSLLALQPRHRSALRLHTATTSIPPPVYVTSVRATVSYCTW